MKRRESQFKTEAALCEAFMAWSRKHGWTPYAETGGWDIILVAKNGLQIGIQAKLRFNVEVLRQTLPAYCEQHERGPDYRGILLGEHPRCEIFDALGIVAFWPWHRSGEFTPELEKGVGFVRGTKYWHDWNPKSRQPLPDYVPDVPAGAPSPLQLTPWKVGALRLCARLAVQGYLTRADFTIEKIDPARWTLKTLRPWLIPGAQRGIWIRGPGLDFEKQHPAVYDQVLQEIRALLEPTKLEREIAPEADAQAALAKACQHVARFSRRMSPIWHWGDGEGGHVLRELRAAAERDLVPRGTH